MIRVIFRGFIGGVQQFEEAVAIEDLNGIDGLALQHVEKLLALPGGELHMIELEFPDTPDPADRFFRIGTDPAAMVAPIPVARIKL